MLRLRALRHGNFLRPTGRRGCARARPQRSGEVTERRKRKSSTGMSSIFFIQAKGQENRRDKLFLTGTSSPPGQARRRGRQSLAAGNLSPQNNLSPQARARMLPVRPIRFRCPSPRPAVCRGSKSVWPGAVRVETLVCAEGARVGLVRLKGRHFYH